MNDNKAGPAELGETELEQAKGGLASPPGPTEIAAESEQTAGRNVRHRSFAIVDRTNL